MTERKERWCSREIRQKEVALLYCKRAPLEKVIQAREHCMHPSQWTNYLWCHSPLQYYCIVTAFQWGSLVGSSLTLRLVSTPMIREKWDLLLRRTDRNWVRRSEVTWRLLRDFLWGWPMCRWGGKDWVSSRVGLRWSPRNLVEVAAGRVIACRSHKAQVEFWRQSWLSKKLQCWEF